MADASKLECVKLLVAAACGALVALGARHAVVKARERSQHIDKKQRIETLRSIYGYPRKYNTEKVLSELNSACTSIISASPFLVISSRSPLTGIVTVSPRGDAPGMLTRVLDAKTLLIPDRSGNKRLDTLVHICESGANGAQIGLIFMVPGWCETLRIHGVATLTYDATLLAPMAQDGVVPRSGLLVKVDEAFPHCAKAVLRADLWGDTHKVTKEHMPSFGRMLAAAVRGNTGAGPRKTRNDKEMSPEELEKLVDSTALMNEKERESTMYNPTDQSK